MSFAMVRGVVGRLCAGGMRWGWLWSGAGACVQREILKTCCAWKMHGGEAYLHGRGQCGRWVLGCAGRERRL
jgi:hypothetical protein